MCSSAAETRFGRNGRQRKSSPERGGNSFFRDCLLLLSYHIGTQKSSKLVVNYGKIVVFRGFREQIGANSGSAVADKKNGNHCFLLCVFESVYHGTAAFSGSGTTCARVLTAYRKTVDFSEGMSYTVGTGKDVRA